MRVCIVSDSHDNRRLLAQAVQQAKDAGAQAVLHAGDVVAPSTLGVLKPLGLPIHVIHGNNSGDLVMMGKVSSREGSLVRYYGQDAGITLAGRKIFIVHYPHYARAMATTGDWDIVIHGHDHKARVQSLENIKGGKTWLVDPGSVAGLDGPPTYIIADLDRLEFNVHALQLDAAAQPTGSDLYTV